MSYWKDRPAYIFTVKKLFLIKSSIVRLIILILAFLQFQIKRSHTRRGNSILRLSFANTIWWWQFGYKDACTPLSITKLDWLVKIRSIHEDEAGEKCALNYKGKWVIQFKVAIVWSFSHHIADVGLKSPVMSTNRGFLVVLSVRSYSKLM